MTDLGAAIEAGARALDNHTESVHGFVLCFEDRDGYARAVIEAALPALLADGWFPPEEAEALREEVVRTHERVHVLLKLAERAVLLKARLAELEASWIPPERVEEIDCPARTQLDAWTAPELVHPPADYCGLCRGSGKLRIVRAETTTMKVEEIDCPVITHRMHLKPSGWTCPLCRSSRGSGKLRIVRAE